MNPGSPRESFPNCPYRDCTECLGAVRPNPKAGERVRIPGVRRQGRYWRAEDSKWISRYRCRSCRKTFSAARFSPCFRQKKRRPNAWVSKLLASTGSQRRTARLLRINRKTVVRKMNFLGPQAKLERLAYID